MTAHPHPERPVSDAETLLERCADEGLPLETSLAELLRHLDRRHERELTLAGGWPSGGAR